MWLISIMINNGFRANQFLKSREFDWLLIIPDSSHRRTAAQIACYRNFQVKKKSSAPRSRLRTYCALPERSPLNRLPWWRTDTARSHIPWNRSEHPPIVIRFAVHADVPSHSCFVGVPRSPPSCGECISPVCLRSNPLFVVHSVEQLCVVFISFQLHPFFKKSYKQASLR